MCNFAWWFYRNVSANKVYSICCPIPAPGWPASTPLLPSTAPLQNSFGPLLRKLGSRVAGKEGKDPRNCSSLSLSGSFFHRLSVWIYSPTEVKPLSAQQGTISCYGWWWLTTGGDQGVREALCWLKRFQNAGTVCCQSLLMGGELGVGLCAPTITLAAQGGHSASRPAGRRTQI